MSVSIVHNMEVAHRLFTVPGKCQQIHGHGMQVTLGVQAQMDQGYICVDGAPVDFGDLKKVFRHYVDTEFDHHLHLNEADPFAQDMIVSERRQDTDPWALGTQVEALPGLKTWPGDPSTENFAVWIYEAMTKQMGQIVNYVLINETKTNAVEYRG
jgi:6-pyruvoyl-tetrahydropterin synthase